MELCVIFGIMMKTLVCILIFFQIAVQEIPLHVIPIQNPVEHGQLNSNSNALKQSPKHHSTYLKWPVVTGIGLHIRDQLQLCCATKSS